MYNQKQNAFNDLNITNNTIDENAIRVIINEIKKYDIIDFISKISSLNLIQENQNKSILLDAIISALLTNSRNQYSSIIKMSLGKFHKIIKLIDQLELSHLIDPAENAFVERIFYYGNYLIFPRTNYSSGYILQGFINILFLRGNSFNPDFLLRASLLINLVLTISNDIAKQLGYGIDMLKHKEIKPIITPDSANLTLLQQCVIIETIKIKELLNDNKLFNTLYIDFTNEDFSNILQKDIYKFYIHPFLKVDDQYTIILNPSILVPFAIHQLIILADNYGIKDEIIDGFNNEIWLLSKKYLNQLGHKKIKVDSLNIELVDNRRYKEIILNVENNGLLIVHYICDEGYGYTQDSMFTTHSQKGNSDFVCKRIEYFSNKLLYKYQENIYQLFIINTFGRQIGITAKKVGVHASIVITPFELLCISINERKQDAFIPRYLNSKDSLYELPNLGISELNSIEIYTSSDYSFYVDDKYNPKTSPLYIPPGDSIDYVIRAIKRTDRQLVESYDNVHLIEVVLNDESRKIYTIEHIETPRAELLIKFSNTNIWIYSPEIFNSKELDIYFSITDAISYWLAECRNIIESLDFTYTPICISILLTGKISDYSQFSQDEKTFDESITFEGDYFHINMIWKPSAYHLLTIKNIDFEKNMIVSILSQLQKRVTNKIDWRLVENMFVNPLKRKFFSFEYTTTPYFKPINDHIHRIHAEDENALLDEIGNYFLSTGQWEYGIVIDEQRAPLANAVVGYLYSRLKEIIAEVKTDTFFELVCYDLEIVIYRLMLVQRRYVYDITCYPEKETYILNEFNELNKSSMALKFLAEYIAACPPNGQHILGKMQYEKMLAICSLIIDWAYKNDLFYYHIFKTPVEFLPSGRIGMKQAEYNKLTGINLSFRKRQLYSISNPFDDHFFPNDIIPDLQFKADEAFLDEYGYSFQQFTKCIMLIIEYGDSLKEEVKRENREILINKLIEQDKDLSKIIVEKIIEQISLTAREDFLKPEDPYVKDDVYPWRFNRNLSFTRRPILCCENDLIWGNRQLYHMWAYTIDLIIDGKYKARGKKLRTLIGILGDKRGNEFNDIIASKLESITGIIVHKKVSKINGKKILGNDGNILGNMDILYIIPELKKIVIAEVKDFSYAKNPYEMNQEYKRMFVDGKKLSYISLHKRRVAWANEHIEDIKMQYNLNESNWKIRDIMIVSEEIISNTFYDKNQKILVYTDLTEKQVKSV